MTGKFPGMPRIKLGAVDARDLAQAHLQACKVEEAKNQRFIISAESLWFRDIAVILKEEFPRYDIKTNDMSYCLMKIAGCFDSTARMMVKMWDMDMDLNSSKAKEILGIRYRPIDGSLKEMGHALVESGIVPKKE